MAEFARTTPEEAGASEPRLTSLRWSFGFETDIGGGAENQDEFFTFSKEEENICIIGVLDGHGREVGRVAANAAKESLLEFISANWAEVRTNPYAFFVRAYEIAHQRIKDSFRTVLTHMGYEVVEDSCGYLLKRRPNNPNWSCVQGGTSCSLAAIVDHKLFVANVGDSTGILCSKDRILSSDLMNYLGDAASPNAPSPRSNTDISDRSDTLIITSEHSPESVNEFKRLREFRAQPNNSLHPELIIIYDSPDTDKRSCPSVFAYNEVGDVVITNQGRYYKNVRKEWASLVATPSCARFHDALAFTRSLGDLHLHTYGVTHLPEVQSLDLKTAFDRLESSTSQESLEGGCPYISLVLASDGVWDNWLYEDVTQFVMDPSCIRAVNESANGAQRVTKAFMKRNSIFSRKNFGSQADNATSIIIYISRVSE